MSNDQAARGTRREEQTWPSAPAEHDTTLVLQRLFLQRPVGAGKPPTGGAEEPRPGGPEEPSPARVEQPPADGEVNGRVAGDIPREPPGFQPRAQLQAELDGAGVSVIQAVTAMAGVGATQLAAAYARARLAAGWRLVAWVNASNAAALAAGMAAVADMAGLSEADTGPDTSDPGLQVRHRLETDGDRCLLVFDDARDPEVLRPFVPVGGAARVLITSDRQPVTDLGPVVPVDVFADDSAQAYLAARTGLADRAGAAAVAAELGYLPLALAQAAAVMAGQRLGYETYLERLREVAPGEQPIRDQGRPYPRAAAGAILLSLKAARTDDQLNVRTKVMEIMAVLSEAGIRRDLLHAAGQAGVLADGGRRLASTLVDRALEQLAGWSLLTFSLDGRTVIAHRLVTRMIRDRLIREGQLAAACRSAASVLETRARALAGSPDRPAVRDIPGQVTALLDHAPEPAGEPDPGLTAVLLRLRFLALYHLIELADSGPQAVAIGEPLTADLMRLLGPRHPDTLNTQNSLAAAYQVAGRTAEAIPLFEQTLAGRRQVLGVDHPDTLNSQNNLAAAYQDTGRAAEAIPLLQRTLAGRERLLGANHPSTLNSRGNLATAYRDAGRNVDAIPLFERTLAGRERVLGPDHPDTLSSRGNLAAAYRDVGRNAEAIPLLEQILAFCERELGEDRRTLAARNNLANAFRDAGRAAEAIPLLEQILAFRERVLGADHSRTLAARNNLALTYRDAGRAAEAIPLLEQTLAACEQQFGTDHPRTLAARNNLANAYRDVGRAAEAIPLLERTLADRERVLGADHPSTVATGKNLALARQEASQPG